MQRNAPDYSSVSHREETDLLCVDRPSYDSISYPIPSKQTYLEIDPSLIVDLMVHIIWCWAAGPAGWRRGCHELSYRVESMGGMGVEPWEGVSVCLVVAMDN